MKLRELLEYYVGSKLELCCGDDCELITRERALSLYEETEVDYMYTSDSDGGSYITVILKEKVK